jgi:hypothetical protein
MCVTLVGERLLLDESMRELRKFNQLKGSRLGSIQLPGRIANYCAATSALARRLVSRRLVKRLASRFGQKTRKRASGESQSHKAGAEQHQAACGQH